MFFNKYTLQQVEEYKEIFNLFKDSGLESFSYKKLKSVLSTMGHYMTNEEIEIIKQKIDKNNDGKIQFEEFLFLLNSDQLVSGSGQLNDVLMKILEKDGGQNLSISKDDLSKIIEQLDFMAPTLEIQEIKRTIVEIFQKDDLEDDHWMSTLVELMKLVEIIKDNTLYF